MKFRLLVKTSCFILCLLLIGKSQASLQANPVNLADNTVNIQNRDFNLSTAEKSALEQGKVILKGEKGNYLGLVMAVGTRESVWEVLTDYNNFENFLPNIASSTIVAESGNNVVFEQTNVVDLWLFQQDFKVKTKAIKQQPDRIDFQIVEGDLKKLIGSWQIQTISANKVLITHRVEVEPAGDIEKPFFYGIYESSLEETLNAIAVEVICRNNQENQQTC